MLQNEYGFDRAENAHSKIWQKLTSGQASLKKAARKELRAETGRLEALEFRRENRVRRAEVRERPVERLGEKRGW